MENFAIIVNKDQGYTSRDVVNCLNKILQTKKIGHTGTLDPLATGVLVCLVGKYTKLVPFLVSNDKEYLVKIKLGIQTDTLDITGKVIKDEKPPKLTKEEIIKVLNNHKGVFKQTIPLYSAKHVNGKRLYEYAHENKEVILPQNKVIIKEINFLSYDNDEITFSCLVSKGTYIRSLVSSICDELNTLGVMRELTRIKQGKFTINKAYTLKDISNGKFTKLYLQDLLDLQVLELKEDIENKVLNGNKLMLDLEGFILFKKDDREIALYNFQNKEGRLLILF